MNKYESDTPAHEHDCDSCVFLGNWTSPERREDGDLYFCQTGGFGVGNWTVIFRFGEYGDYSSGASFSVPRGGQDGCPDLTEAARRAVECGFLSQEQWDAQRPEGEIG